MWFSIVVLYHLSRAQYHLFSAAPVLMEFIYFYLTAFSVYLGFAFPPLVAMVTTYMSCYLLVLICDLPVSTFSFHNFKYLFFILIFNFMQKNVDDRSGKLITSMSQPRGPLKRQCCTPGRPEKQELKKELLFVFFFRLNMILENHDKGSKCVFFFCFFVFFSRQKVILDSKDKGSFFLCPFFMSFFFHQKYISTNLVRVSN